MLRVDIRDLQRGPVRTVGELRPTIPRSKGLDLNLVGPVAVTGQLQATGQGEYLWRGRIQGAMQGECRRCLADVAPKWTSRWMPPSSAPIPRRRTIPISIRCWNGPRISISGTWCGRSCALAAPARLLLCREDCAGLCLTLWSRSERGTLRLFRARRTCLRKLMAVPEASNLEVPEAPASRATTARPGLALRRVPAAALPSSRIASAIRADTTGARSRSRSRTSERDPRRGRRYGGRHRPAGGNRRRRCRP